MITAVTATIEMEDGTVLGNEKIRPWWWGGRCQADRAAELAARYFEFNKVANLIVRIGNSSLHWEHDNEWVKSFMGGK